MKLIITSCMLFFISSSFAHVPNEIKSSVGITIESTTDSTYVIREVVLGSQAFKAGLKENDLITTMKKDENSAPVEVAHRPIIEVAALLRGPKGSSLTLEVLQLPANDMKKVTLIRNGESPKK